MGDLEWPLITFTVLGQVGIGIILMLWWLNRDHLDSKLLRKGTLVSGILLALALLASLFHLGHPEAAYRALTHLASSWLSREILLFLLTFLAWIYLYWKSRQPSSNPSFGLGVTSVLGLMGVVSSAMIYVLPRVPAWNNIGPVFFFLLTTGLLGALCTLVLGKELLQPAQRKRLLQGSLGFTILSLLITIVYGSMLSATVEGAATLNFLLSNPLFWARALLGWIAPLVLLIALLKKGHVEKPQLIVVVTVLAALGEILGRILFYLSAVGIHINALF
ncbi:dimethyl sulfoxide reductase anchor subunit family protein [Desulfosporosinus metallidurans]|uniref:Anaerobic dimethyl sulfoxide reductase chain C n=1 Tax=Desulfosporosinus metallidurans TaxID=1888891 RepID=A0A1Q8QYU6_9FIRM|nr:DmsC/YnfH family molybdoenzyme membrane anchor subunit [Desulfosporosinus metallidurans]OLN32549.1 Anaerobic dimethyl sulfoxide reductase chain C [Desulfosporosinus metallidurans]